MEFLFFLLVRDTYVVSSAQLADGVVLLYAISLYSTPSVLPIRTLNWKCRIIKKDGTSKTIDLYPENKRVTRIFLNATLSKAGSIDGKMRKTPTNIKGCLFVILLVKLMSMNF